MHVQLMFRVCCNGHPPGDQPENVPSRQCMSWRMAALFQAKPRVYERMAIVMAYRGPGPDSGAPLGISKHFFGMGCWG
jgi:hypothetical protein